MTGDSKRDGEVTAPEGKIRGRHDPRLSTQRTCKEGSESKRVSASRLSVHCSLPGLLP